MCQCKINDENFEFSCDSTGSALDLIREKGLTGAKRVCNSGVCGACAVEMDGETVNTCITPVSNLKSKEIKTIEAFSSSDSLHPMQKAFIDNDALQCGFCTPGFVVESINFYNKWRSEHSADEAPNRETIAEALSGHLCRCGAYPNIYTAVHRACAGEYDGDSSDVTYHRYDAVEKVTGKAKYTYDINIENQLIGYIYRSPHPHAIVKKINYEELLSLEGVIDLIELLPTDRTVRFVGKEIFAVAVESKSVIDKVNETVQVDYEIKSFVIDDREAQESSAPQVYGRLEKKLAHDSAEGFLPPGRWIGRNIRSCLTMASTKAKKALEFLSNVDTESGDRLFEKTFQTSAQVHTALEPHVCIAEYIGNNELNVYLSTQGVDAMADEIAKNLDLPRENVKVFAEYIGGGFGSKLSLNEEAIAACRLAIRTGCAVRVEYSREEELAYGGIRAGSDMRVSLLTEASHHLKAFSFDTYSYSGVGIGYACVPYLKHEYGNVPRVVNEYDVVTNKSPGRPFRAPGAPNVYFALESIIDDVAYELNEDPIDLRLNWDLHDNKRVLLEIAKETDMWKTRNTGPKSERFMKGVGVAAATWPYWYSEEVKVELIASSYGITAKTAIQDIGTGSKSIIRDTIRQHFDIPETLINVLVGNSGFEKGVTSGGSMTTSSTYYAVVKACRELQKNIAEKLFRDDVKEVSFSGVSLSEEFISWGDALKLLNVEVSVIEGRGKDTIFDNKVIDTLRGKNSSCNVVVTEVEVDTLLNKFKVTRVWSGVAAGKIVSRKLAENQVFGGVIQGIGYALFEEKIYDNRYGYPLTTNLETYKIPTLSDTPEIEVFFHEGGFSHVKGNVLGLAEVVTIPIAGSIGNAIFNATGKRPTKLPISFENFNN